MNPTAKKMTSSKSVERVTPQWVVDWLAEFYGPFDLDPAATTENAKAERFYTEADDGLKQPWNCIRAFCNPPYGKDAGKWVAKAYDEVAQGRCGEAVLLLKSTTGTKWFQTYATKCTSLLFVKGRIPFEADDIPEGTPATFDSLIMSFGRHPLGQGVYELATWGLVDLKLPPTPLKNNTKLHEETK